LSLAAARSGRATLTYRTIDRLWLALKPTSCGLISVMKKS
jgi:hypothetical protein